MKKVFYLITFILLAGGVALWWFVRKDNNMYRLVPKDAHIVLSLSIPNLIKEVSLEELKNLHLGDNVKDELMGLKDTLAAKRIKELFESGSTFGVDYKSDVIFYTTRYEGLDFQCVVFDISDPAEFRKFVNAIDPGLIIDMKANYSVLDLSDGLFLAWNKRGGIFIRNEYNYAYARRIIRSNFIVETFSRSEENCILGLPQYVNSKNDQDLISVFANYCAMDSAKVREYDDGEVLRKKESLYSLPGMNQMYIAGGISHENQTLVMNASMKSLVTNLPVYGGFETNGISDAHARAIAEKDPLFCFAAAARKEWSVDSLFEAPEELADFEKSLGEIGLNKLDLALLLKAEFSMAFHGFSKVPFNPETDRVPLDRSLLVMGEDGAMFSQTPTFSMQLIFQDKTQMHRIMESLMAHNPNIEHDGDHWFVQLGGFRLHLVETPLGLCATNQVAWLDKFKAGNLGVLSDQLMNGLTQNGGYLYFNANKETYDAGTQELLTKFSGRDDHVAWWDHQFDNLSMTMNDGRIEMRLKLRDGEPMLINRILKIYKEAKNPIVS
jgi:Domain of unknown function (DUF4836)